jgi:uroporphyrinogen-III synthase
LEAELNVLRVAVTRPRERTGRTCRTIRETGFIAVQRSLLRFESDEAGLTGAADGLHAYEWLLLTSAEAVHALDAVRRAAGWEWPASLRAACVGPATAAAARAAGVPVGLMPSFFDGRSLAQELVRGGDIEGRRFFWPRAEAANTGLADTLRAAGGVVTDVIAYRTVPHAAGGERLKRDIAAGRIDAVLFFSPSAVDAYMALVGPASNVVIGALGRSTAERATSYGLRVHVQPPTHTIRDLGEALREYVQAEGMAP